MTAILFGFGTVIVFTVAIFALISTFMWILEKFGETAALVLIGLVLGTFLSLIFYFVYNVR